MLAFHAMVCSARADLKTRLLLTLLLIFSAALPRAVADEWISDEYRCALTIPTQESWTAALRQQLPNGEVIFHAASMSTNQGLMVTYVPDMPSGDLNHPALVKRITELLESQGWKAEESSRIQWKGRTFIQFIAQRRDVVTGKLIGIARATMREKSLYVITAYGKGEADRANDADFMRVMETFRFVDQPTVIINHPEGPSAKVYRFAMLGAGAAAGMLLIGLGVMFLISRVRDEESA